ncbi:MAG: hypothetical protein WC108_05740 [Bacteroidales bacterium]|nr:hypothetical protein [Bacteroidales bacterium]
MKMLEINYELLRNEGVDHDTTFKPLLTKINGNAASLIAPNSSGKSYLLNLIALGLYGDRITEKEGHISPLLLENIKDIRNRKNESLTFDIKITSFDGKLQLHAKKEVGNLEKIVLQQIIDGGTPMNLPFDTFKRNYYLVYDFPKNPLERIPDMVQVVEDQQSRYQSKVNEFFKYVIEVEGLISESRNEGEIKEIKEKIKYVNTNLERINGELVCKTDKKSVIEQYLSLKGYLDHYLGMVECQHRVEELDKNIETEMKNKKKYSNKYINQRDKVNDKLTPVSQNLRNIMGLVQKTKLIDNETVKKQLDYFKKIKITDCLETCKLPVPEIDSRLNLIKKEILPLLANPQVKEAGITGKFYQAIIDLLSEYKNKGLSISIPGTDKPLEQIISALNSEAEKTKFLNDTYVSLTGINEGIKNVSKLLESIPKELSTLELLKNSKKSIDDSPVDFNKADDIVENLNKKSNEHYKHIEYYKRILQDYGYDTSLLNEDIIQKKLSEFRATYANYLPIFLLDEGKLKQEVAGFQNEIDTITNGTKKSLDQKETQYTQRLYSLESKKPHPYYDRRNEVETIKKIVDSISRKLGDFEEYIKDIRDEKALDTLAEKYNDKIGQYLASTIPSFPYQEEFIKPIKIDLATKMIHTDKARVINMKDVSTGQSMSLYIQAILNRPADDKRKLIVLFDEASTMDTNSFAPLKESLIKLVKENKVLFALFVMASRDKMTTLSEIV